MSVSSGGGKVFGWFANLTSICGMITWTGICFTYLRFYAGLKAQGIDRSKLPYASRFQPFAAYFGFVTTIIICFVSCSSHMPVFNYTILIMPCPPAVQWMDCFPQGQ